MLAEAVVLSYLEWVRLIERNWIKLDRSRLVRYDSNLENYFDVVCDLMRNAPDVGMSATDFILANLRPVVLQKIRFFSSIVGERLMLDDVDAFHSFTANALAVHEHDASTRNIAIHLSSPAFSDGWQAWSNALTGIAADCRGQAFLSKLHLALEPGHGFDDIIARFKSLVEFEKIAKAQDTMVYGWLYVLSAAKNILGEVSLSKEAKEELNVLRSDFDHHRPFLSCAPHIKKYLLELMPEKSELLSSGPKRETVDRANFLAIAAFKHYERYNIKTEGRDFNFPCFQDDVREIARINQGAAAFLVYQMGARLTDSVIASLPEVPISNSVAAPSADHADSPAFLAAGAITAADSLEPKVAPPGDDLWSRHAAIPDQPAREDENTQNQASLDDDLFPMPDGKGFAQAAQAAASLSYDAISQGDKAPANAQSDLLKSVEVPAAAKKKVKPKKPKPQQ